MPHSHMYDTSTLDGRARPGTSRQREDGGAVAQGSVFEGELPEPFIYAGTIPTPEQTPGSDRTRTPSTWTQPPTAAVHHSNL
ncbi:hypothetical protein GCM10022403_084400 [Streptomyces coacervatus]|uniref:Homogentisate 1,2-dioxygenase n=1 Tax=Streptomyces coacervatus TaxID=647381 RepID=A0ABP7JBU0_9ACTN